MKRKDDIHGHIKGVLTVNLFFLGFYYLTNYNWAITVSFFVGLIGVSSELGAKRIDSFWIKTTLLLSMLVQNTLLSLTYILILTPLAYLSRIFTSPNQLTLKNTEQTMFKDRDLSIKRDSFEKIW